VIVHLLEYRAVPGHEAELTGFLRRRPLLMTPGDGIAAVVAARRLSQQGREHLTLTCWRDSASLDHSVDGTGLPTHLAPMAPLIGDRVSSRYRAVSSSGLGRPGARVLRVYRTSVSAADVGNWEARALESAGQLMSKEGVTLVLAGAETGVGEAAPRSGDVRVVVVTAWTEWDLLLAATGGLLNRPLLDTELADLERPAVADHFEIIVSEPGPP